MTFNEKKATQCAAYLLRLRGGRMSYLKLVKLLYLADREALKRWGSPITTDCYYSMPKGPVVSNIYNLMREEEDKAYWSSYITPPLGQFELALTALPCPTGELSRAEEKLLTDIFAEFGQMTRWQLVDYTHTLPEWKDPQGTSSPIHIEEILRAQGRAEEEIAEIMSDLQAEEKTEILLGSVA